MFIDSKFALIFYRGCFSVDDEITHVYVTHFFYQLKKMKFDKIKHMVMNTLKKKIYRRTKLV